MAVTFGLLFLNTHILLSRFF